MHNLQRNGDMPLQQTNNVSKRSFADGSSSVSMVREIPLRSNLPKKPTKDCPREWDTTNSSRNLESTSVLRSGGRRESINQSINQSFICSEQCKKTSNVTVSKWCSSLLSRSIVKRFWVENLLFPVEIRKTVPKIAVFFWKRPRV